MKPLPGEGRTHHNRDRPPRGTLVEAAYPKVVLFGESEYAGAPACVGFSARRRDALRRQGGRYDREPPSLPLEIFDYLSPPKRRDMP